MHPVHIAPLTPDALPLDAYSSVAVLLDQNTAAHCYPRLRPYLPAHTCIQIRSGEEQKHIQTCQEIWHALTYLARADRSSVLLNLGGGVIGDMGGFCAATYQRGIDFIQIPTTLLAQVDASVGAKLGVDFDGLKNQIGLFGEPRLVWIDPAFLQTLPEQELRSGFAEIIKHCLIADAQKWQSIRGQTDIRQQDLPDLIQHSVAIKTQIVQEDPRERGRRKCLNFGHTLGHALETFSLSGQGLPRLLHGEAIAVGMVAEAWLSHQKCGLPRADYEAIRVYMQAVFGRVPILPAHLPEVIRYAQHDKKNKGQQVRAALLGGAIGQCTFDVPLTDGEIESAFLAYLND